MFINAGENQELDPVSDEIQVVLCSLTFSFALYSQIGKMLATRNQVETLKCNFILNNTKNIKVIRRSL